MEMISDFFVARAKNKNLDSFRSLNLKDLKSKQQFRWPYRVRECNCHPLTTAVLEYVRG